MGRRIRTLIVATGIAAIIGVAFPASSVAGTRHTCALRPFAMSDLGRTVVTQTDDEIRVEWLAMGSTTLNCPPGDSADEAALDVWEHAYYFWEPLPDDRYITEGQGRTQLLFQNPIFDDDGQLTARGSVNGPVRCEFDVCDVNLDIRAGDRDGSYLRLTLAGRLDLAANEWVILRVRDGVLSWDEGLGS